MDVREQADELVSIIENNAGEPDAIVRAIAPIYRKAEAAKDNCEEVLWYMIKAAFNRSAAHSWAFEEYLAAIEQGREPSEEALAHFASRGSEDQPAELEADDPARSEVEIIHGSAVLLMSDKGKQLFRFDLAETTQSNNAIEFYVLDEAGARVHSMVVKTISTDPEEVE